MPDDLAGNAAPTQPEPIETQSDATPETVQTDTPAPIGDPTENGKKSLKVPDSLKPKPRPDKEPSWVNGRVAHYANELKSAKARIAELESSKEVKPQKIEQTTDAPPNPDDFEKYQDYVDALVDYKVSLREKVQQQKKTEEGARQYQQERRAEFEQHAQAIVEQVPEFWDAVTDPSLPVTDAMAEAVMELGQLAPFTMLWLASNRQEALRIAKLPPRAATVAIGKLAVQLEKTLMDDADGQATASEPAKPQFTPKPVPQIRGSAPGNLNDGPSDKDDARTWMVKEAERQRKKFGNPNLRVYVPR